MSRNRQQGTKWERDIIELAESCGLKAWRLAEHGSNDQGDVIVRTGAGEHVVVEAKCRGNLTVHPAVEKARAKAGHPSVPFDVSLACVAWKRLVSTDGERRRQPGRPVAVLDLEDFMRLLARRGRVRLRA